jgi:hypothetical protein
MDLQKTNQTKPVKPIHQLLAREVNRTEFLSIVGVGLLTVVGLGPLLNFLTGKGGSKTTIVHNKKSSGFGSGPYGI